MGEPQAGKEAAASKLAKAKPDLEVPDLAGLRKVDRTIELTSSDMPAVAPNARRVSRRRVDTALLLLIAAGFLIFMWQPAVAMAFSATNWRRWKMRATSPQATSLIRPSRRSLGESLSTLFGTSLRGFRFFAALAQAVITVLGGLMARELGGRRFAQVVAALAVAISPVSLASGDLMQYVAFDYLFWVLTAYLLMRLLRTGERAPVAGHRGGDRAGHDDQVHHALLRCRSILAGLLLTDARRYLISRWLWLGVAVSLLVFLPNLIWQIRHSFISLDFLHHIHARDIRMGRTKGFLPDQLKIAANPFTIPLWLAGLFFYFRSPEGKRFRLIGWMFVVTLVIFSSPRAADTTWRPHIPCCWPPARCWRSDGCMRFRAGMARAAARWAPSRVLAIGGVLPRRSPCRWRR